MPQNIVIADLDGTIALIDHRRHWLDEDQHTELSSDERWRMFFKACVVDLPNEPVIEALKALSARGFEVHIFSGRSDEVKEITLAWLDVYGVPYRQIRMRQADDFTPDEVLKLSWLADYDKTQILCIFDDRKKVVDMWRAEGLSCFQVAPGDF